MRPSSAGPSGTWGERGTRGWPLRCPILGGRHAARRFVPTPRPPGLTYVSPAATPTTTTVPPCAGQLDCRAVDGGCCPTTTHCEPFGCERDGVPLKADCAASGCGPRIA